MEQRDINFLKMTSGVISGMDSEKPLWDKEVEKGIQKTQASEDYKSRLKVFAFWKYAKDLNKLLSIIMKLKKQIKGLQW